MSELPGFKYLGKKQKERYSVTPSVAKELRKRGVKVEKGTISKRAYRNLQLQREGYRNLHQRESETQPGSAPKMGKKHARFLQRRRHIELFAEREGISVREAAKHTSALERAWREVEAERKANNGRIDKTWGGAFHRYLMLLGFQFVEAEDGSFVSE